MAGITLGWLGYKKRPRASPPDDDEQEMRERLRILEAERVETMTRAMEDRIVAKIELTDERQSLALELGLKANRTLYFEAFEKYHNDREDRDGKMMDKMDGIDRCVRRLETEFAAQRADVDALKSGRRPPR